VCGWIASPAGVPVIIGHPQRSEHRPATAGLDSLVLSPRDLPPQVRSRCPPTNESSPAQLPALPVVLHNLFPGQAFLSAGAGNPRDTHASPGVMERRRGVREPGPHCVIPNPVVSRSIFGPFLLLHLFERCSHPIVDTMEISANGSLNCHRFACAIACFCSFFHLPRHLEERRLCVRVASARK
jgi:hypothetical protein